MCVGWVASKIEIPQKVFKEAVDALRDLGNCVTTYDDDGNRISSVRITD